MRTQVEYYFGVENLCRDTFLRSKMNEEGWIPLPVIAGQAAMVMPEATGVQCLSSALLLSYRALVPCI